MTRILIVEDDRVFSGLLEKFLTKNGYEITLARGAGEAVEKVQSEQSYDFIISDYRLPDATGLELMHRIRDRHPAMPVLLMTGYSDTRVAVQAMKQGAVDYVLKPVNPDEVLHTIQSALAKGEEVPATDVQEATPDKEAPAPTADTSFIGGKSEAMQAVLTHVDLVAPTDLSVIIQGESGTGKEYLAREIYRRSKRKDKPFVALDCGTLTKQLADSELFGHAKGAFTGALTAKKGQFEYATGGTLFLDEVGNLSYEVQVKLLRAIQERTIRRVGENNDIPVDVRIITATNDDLRNKVAAGKFREDLYHRLNEFSLHLPPLRERHEDVLLFAEHFRQRANDELSTAVEGFEDEVMTLFRHYKWPGNLREMRNIVRRAVLITGSGRIGRTALPPEMFLHTSAAAPVATGEQTTAPATAGSLHKMNEANEKALILKTLTDVRFNKSKAARILQIDRKTLYNKMEKYDLL